MTFDKPSLTEMEAASRLAAIVESSDDAIISKDLNGYVTSWNAGAERMFGYSAEEAIGRHISFIVPADLRSQEDDILARLRGGERIDHFETVRLRRDGSAIQVSITVSPVRNSAGDIVGASKISRDITDAKRHAETRELLLNEIKHRVKNMLSIIDSIAMQSLRGLAKPVVAEFGARIRALAAAHDVMTEQNWKGSDLATLLDKTLAPFHGKHSERLSTAGPLVMLNANTSLLLGLIFHELATNAMKYGAWSSGAGQVEVTWSYTDGDIELLWREKNGPKVSPPTQSGFGSSLISRVLKHSGSTGEISFPEAGVSCRLRLSKRVLVQTA